MYRSWFLPLVSLALLPVLLAPAVMGQPAPEPPRAFLGVAVGSGKAADKDGVLVDDVAPNSPAAKAGVKSGDLIFKLNGQPVSEVKDFLNRVAAKKPGDKIELRVRRDGKEHTLTATLAERPVAGAGAPPLLAPGGGLPGGGLPGLRRPVWLGVQVEPLTAERAKQLGVKAEAGAVVTEVVPKSPAAKAGLQTDDVITAVNADPVRDPEGLRAAVQKAGAGKEATLKVVRGKEQKTFKATLGEVPGGLVPMPPGGPFGDLDSLLGGSSKIRELERRVDELQKRVDALEKRQGSPSKK